VASGTWMLAGVELPGPDTSAWARERNYTNEAGALAGFRFLRNITGFWLLEQCRPHWGTPDVADLFAAAERVEADVPVVDVDHPSLRAPDDMLLAYTTLAGLSRDAAPGLLTRSIVESIATRTSQVVIELAGVAEFDDVILFGGAARIPLLVRRLAELTHLPVRLGSAEAAALGNAIVQGVAVGALSSLTEGQAKVAVGH